MVRNILRVTAILMTLLFNFSWAQENESKNPSNDYISYADTSPGFGDTIPGFKSPNSAVWLSVMGTVVPIASGTAMLITHNHKIPSIGLIFWGGLVGPAHGRLYTGDLKGAAEGALLRVILVGSTYLLWKYVPNAEPSSDWEAEDSGDKAAALLLIVPGLYVYATIVDIIKVRETVREHNYNVLNERGISIGPAYFPKPKAIGVGLSFRF